MLDMVPFTTFRVTHPPPARLSSPMPSRSAARLELAAAAILFSTGGAAVKAADFTGWQITCLRSGIAAIAIWLMTRQARGAWSARHLVVGVAYAACLTFFVLANRL